MAAYIDAVLADNPDAYWTLDRRFGGTDDYSGNGWNLYPDGVSDTRNEAPNAIPTPFGYNALNTSMPGVAGSRYEAGFDFGTGNWSYELWFYYRGRGAGLGPDMRSQDYYTAPFAQGAGDGNNIGVFFRPQTVSTTQFPYSVYQIELYGEADENTNIPIPHHEWTHLGFSYDRTGGGGAKVYQNGKLIYHWPDPTAAQSHVGIVLFSYDTNSTRNLFAGSLMQVACYKGQVISGATFLSRNNLMRAVTDDDTISNVEGIYGSPRNEIVSTDFTGSIWPINMNTIGNADATGGRGQFDSQAPGMAYVNDMDFADGEIEFTLDAANTANANGEFGVFWGANIVDTFFRDETFENGDRWEIIEEHAVVTNGGIQFGQWNADTSSYELDLNEPGGTNFENSLATKIPKGTDRIEFDFWLEDAGQDNDWFAVSLHHSNYEFGGNMVTSYRGLTMYFKLHGQILFAGESGSHSSIPTISNNFKYRGTWLPEASMQDPSDPMHVTFQLRRDYLAWDIYFDDVFFDTIWCDDRGQAEYDNVEGSGFALTTLFDRPLQDFYLRFETLDACGANVSNLKFYYDDPNVVGDKYLESGFYLSRKTIIDTAATPSDGVWQLWYFEDGFRKDIYNKGVDRDWYHPPHERALVEFPAIDIDIEQKVKIKQLGSHLFFKNWAITDSEPDDWTAVVESIQNVEYNSGVAGFWSRKGFDAYQVDDTHEQTFSATPSFTTVGDGYIGSDFSWDAADESLSITMERELLDEGGNGSYVEFYDEIGATPSEIITNYPSFELDFRVDDVVHSSAGSRFFIVFGDSDMIAENSHIDNSYYDLIETAIGLWVSWDTNDAHMVDRDWEGYQLKNSTGDPIIKPFVFDGEFARKNFDAKKVTDAGGVGVNIPEHILGTGEDKNNYFFTPSQSDTDFDVTDLDLRVHLSREQWDGITSHGSAEYFFVRVDKLNSSVKRIWLFGTGYDGKMRFYWTEDGSTWKNYTSTNDLPFSDGDAAWLRVTMDVDNGAGGYDLEFYTSTDTTNDPDAVSWTSFQTSVGGATTSFHTSSNSDVAINDFRYSSQNPLKTETTIYRATMYDGIDGSKKLDFNPSDWNDSKLHWNSSTTGESWRSIPFFTVHKRSTRSIMVPDEAGDTWPVIRHTLKFFIDPSTDEGVFQVDGRTFSRMPVSALSLAGKKYNRLAIPKPDASATSLGLYYFDGAIERLKFEGLSAAPNVVWYIDALSITATDTGLRKGVNY